METFDLNNLMRKNWSTKELKKHVKLGTFTKYESVTEHIALHPYWLGKPIQGIHEFLDHRLGQWMRRLGGYLVAYSDIKRDPNVPSTIHIDQPWIHIDVLGKFYVFTPEVGQILQGVVKKLGATAAICVALNYFSITVLPGTDFAVKISNSGNLNLKIEDWTIDTELEFRIISYNNRTKGPQLRAKCLRVINPSFD